MKEKKINLRNELHIIVDPKLLKRLRMDAVKNDKSVGAFVRLILEDYYAK